MLELYRYRWGIWLVIGFVLAACGATSPAANEVLPTIAILAESTTEPSVTQSAEPTAPVTVESTPVSVSTEIAASMVPPSQMLVTPTALDLTQAAAIGGELGIFPDTFVIGEQVALRGLLTVTDAPAGLAVLTDLHQRTVDLLIDAFTVAVADHHLVEIIGEVIARPESESGVAVQMTGIRLLTEEKSAESTADPHQSGVTASPPGG